MFVIISYPKNIGSRDMLSKENIIITIKSFLLSFKSFSAFLGMIRLDCKNCHFHQSESENSELKKKCDFALC